MAHFHYTIMGGLIFALLRGDLLLGAEDDRPAASTSGSAKIHFWTMFISFNSTFMPLFVLGMQGMPRRVVTYAPNLRRSTCWVSISAFVLGFSMLVFLFNVVYSLIFVREPAEHEPVALEVDRVAAAHAGAGQQLRADPGDRLRPLRLRHAARRRRTERSRCRREAERWPLPHEEQPLGLQIPPVAPGVEIPPEPPDVGARALSVAVAAAGGRDDVLLPGLRVRLLLPALAERRPHVEARSTSNPTRRSARRSSVCSLLSGALRDRSRAAQLEARTAQAGLARRPARSGSGWRRSCCSASSTPSRTSAPPTAPTRACSARGRPSTLLAVLATMYWLETHVATELRARREPAPPASGDIKDPDRLIAPGLDAAVFYWCFLAAIGRAHLRRALPRLACWPRPQPRRGSGDWSLDPPLVLIVDSRDPLLARRQPHGHAGARAPRAQRIRDVAFYAATRGARDRARLAARAPQRASCSGCTWSSTCC